MSQDHRLAAAFQLIESTFQNRVVFVLNEVRQVGRHQDIGLSSPGRLKHMAILHIMDGDDADSAQS